MEKLKVEQAITMLRLQDKMNSTVNPQWMEAEYPFLRAVLVEVGEALDHYGWKWWKKQSSDLPQVQIELIDILHFMLSASLLEARGNYDSAATSIIDSANPDQQEIEFDGKTYSLKDSDIRVLLELLAGLAASRRISYALLEACFKKCELDWSSAFSQYVSKNVLNIFRQDNGYKEGTYIKEWEGKEDNVHLASIIQNLDSGSSQFSEDLYDALASRYKLEKLKRQK